MPNLPYQTTFVYALHFVFRLSFSIGLDEEPKQGYQMTVPLSSCTYILFKNVCVACSGCICILVS